MKSISISVLSSILLLSSSTAFQPTSQQFLVGHQHRHQHTTALLAKTKSRARTNVDIDIDSIERQAETSAQNWDIAVTPFLNDKEATQLQTRLSNRADIRYIQIGTCDCGFVLPSDDDDDDDGSSDDEDDNDARIKSKTRTRFVMTNPDMELNIQETEASYCKLLCIDNIQSANIPQSSSRSKPWPSMLMRIGIDLTNVGHVIHDVDEDCVYMVVVPEVARQCSRLLPKELRGVGITVREIDLMVSTGSTDDNDDDNDDSEEYVAPYNGVLQDMELGSIDLRSLKYK